MTAEPLGPVTADSVGPGETFTARRKVTVNSAGAQVVAALSAANGGTGTRGMAEFHGLTVAGG
jgi:hypothetical protein